MKNKLLLFLVFVLFFLWNLQNVNAGVNIFETTRTLPEGKIVSQTGDSFKLSDFKGNFVLAHFWSRNCGPCIKELKSLNAFHNKVKNDNIRLILISPQSEWFDMNEQRLFLKRYGAPDVEFYVEENNNLSANFGIFRTPHTVIINQNGEEAGRLAGSETWDKQKVIDFIKNLKQKLQ